MTADAGQGAPKGRRAILTRELALRVASAVVLLPLVVWLVLWERRFGFAVLAIGAGTVALSEYAAIALGKASARERRGVVLVGTALAVWIYVFPGLAHEALIATVILLGGLSLWSNDIPTGPLRFGAGIAGAFYIGGLVPALPILQRDVPNGPSWVLLAMVLTFGNDTGAYFSGKTFGRRKLAPAISPGKTVEGLVGAIVVTFALVFGARATLFPSLTLRDCLIIAPIASVVGPVGDLVKSLLKRAAGVKDSGRLIPGHGGALDRIDALLFVGAYMLIHARHLH